MKEIFYSPFTGQVVDENYPGAVRYVEAAPAVSVYEKYGERLVRLRVGDVDLLIEREDMKSPKGYDVMTWYDAIATFKETGIRTFNKREAFFVLAYLYDINLALKEVGGSPLGKSHWLSENYNTNYACSINYNSRELHSNYEKNTMQRVRACRTANGLIKD